MIQQAEEITLTIGQAFELAYKKFLESKSKDLEKEKQSLVLQKRIEFLENENKELKKRLSEVAKIKGDDDVKDYMKENNVRNKDTQKQMMVNDLKYEFFSYRLLTSAKWTTTFRQVSPRLHYSRRMKSTTT